MESMHLHVPYRVFTIRTLVALWAGSLFFAWALLVAGWLVANGRLEDFGARVSTDVKALDVARELEREILAHRREDLLWEATGLDYHRHRSDEYLLDAERIAENLDPYVTTSREIQLLSEIRQRLTLLSRTETPPDSVEVDAKSVYGLLDALDQFQAQNKHQMEESIRAASRLRQTISRWAIGLLASTAGLLAFGTLIVSRRVAGPALALTSVAEAFGKGDFAARSPVRRNDELGVLARTFNNMASDIADREKARLRFVAMVAHDLKNPVLAIEMTARLLREASDDQQQRHSYLDALATEAKRLRTIVRDLTDDVQVASGHFTVRKAPVDLCALVRRLIQAQAAAFSRHQLVLDMPQICTVSGDAGRLERVVMNLVSNAVKYSPPGTCVTLRIEEDRHSLVLTVSDQGPGIPQEDLKVLFQPFGRGRSADALAEGTGVGLYVVRQIVEAHGGKIDVQSEFGKGATFRVRLPLESQLVAKACVDLLEKP